MDRRIGLAVHQIIYCFDQFFTNRGGHYETISFQTAETDIDRALLQWKSGRFYLRQAAHSYIEWFTDQLRVFLVKSFQDIADPYPGIFQIHRPADLEIQVICFYVFTLIYQF